MKLTEIRKSRGITQAQLAEMVGVDQSTIQRAEKMHASAKLETYVLCAGALGVTLDQIFNDERTTEEALVLRGFREMPAALQKSVLALAASVLEEVDPNELQKPETDDYSC